MKPTISDLAKLYNKPETEFVERLDGRIEWRCSHNIGHTVWFPKGNSGVHGCDGCCGKLNKRKGMYVLKSDIKELLAELN